MMLPPSTSTRFSLNGIDAWKSARTALVSLAGFILVAIAQWATATDFGVWQAVIVPFVVGLTEAGRRYLADYAARDAGATSIPP